MIDSVDYKYTKNDLLQWNLIHGYTNERREPQNDEPIIPPLQVFEGSMTCVGTGSAPHGVNDNK